MFQGLENLKNAGTLSSQDCGERRSSHEEEGRAINLSTEDAACPREWSTAAFTGIFRAFPFVE